MPNGHSIICLYGKQLREENLMSEYMVEIVQSNAVRRLLSQDVLPC